MRIVTRPDFDGVVCAVLLYEAENVTAAVKWVQPNAVQKGLVDIRPGDVLANLPHDERCSLWFDHHYTNRTDKPFKGGFRLTPSAARIIFDHYRKRFQRDYSDLVAAADKIDAANLSQDEVLYPEKHAYILLSMTIWGGDAAEEPYWNRLVALLRKGPIDTVMQDPIVKERCRRAIEQNRAYQDHLLKHTEVKGHVAITDFRPLGLPPEGNRFLVYSLFPDATVSVKIRYDGGRRETIAVSVGHSIFNPQCRVNVGKMLAAFEGGGHRGAGSSRFNAGKADDYIPRMIDILLKNAPNDG